MSTADIAIGEAADPAELGFSAERLARLDRHLERYVDDGRLPGWLMLVTRRGRVAHLSSSGRRDLESGAPVEPDTLWRIYSMTKPVTSVAAMMLWEEGAFELKDPVARFIPAFEAVRVYVRGSAQKPLTAPAGEPIRIWHLLTHTSGLTYGFHHAHAVDEMYRAGGFEWSTPPGLDLAGCCEAWARLPLLFQPGTEWNYSVSTDVLGRVVEVVSGRSLDAFFAERIFAPLGMTETTFHAAEELAPRLAALYSPDPSTGRATRNDAMGAAASRPPDALSGGGGLVSTAADYHRFTQMLLGEGQLDGVRLLGPRTVRYMAKNHLPADLETFGRPLFAETTFEGVGFGLGFSVVEDPVQGRFPSSRGEFAWGGAASTAFWVDPAEELTVLFFTQLLPSSTYSIRPQLHQLVHQALLD
ncbi:MAG TPA: serine hydrolase domain-containing protein [Solirubrobacteraceae bacterium]|nr:serine hydrolase domain-containing protein [Solirubrobacteraceae bacterium]